MNENEIVKIKYKNYKNEISFRYILPIKILYESNMWHKVPQWILEAVDINKNETRKFAIKDIMQWIDPNGIKGVKMFLNKNGKCSVNSSINISDIDIYIQQRNCDHYLKCKKHPLCQLCEYMDYGKCNFNKEVKNEKI